MELLELFNRLIVYNSFVVVNVIIEIVKRIISGCHVCDIFVGSIMSMTCPRIMPSLSWSNAITWLVVMVFGKAHNALHLQARNLWRKVW